MQQIIALSLALLAACSGPQAEPTSDSNATTGTTEAASTSTAMPTTGGDTDASCDGPEGCYACEPGEPAQVLNHCTDAACQPFPNTSQRLPLLRMDGTLPPVP